MSDRMALVTLKIPALPDGGVVSATGYSRFKHGDALYSGRFGKVLADAFEQGPGRGVRREIWVTSSGFGSVPPAAHSLVRPFARALGIPSRTVEVRRRGISAGDYARMAPGARRAAVSSDCMSVDRDLTGAHVVALDDIRVTGTHEDAMDACLVAAGAARIHHLYLVDAHAYAGAPAVESALNEAAVRDVHDLLAVATGPSFQPNARVCRRVMQLPRAQLAHFVAHAPEAVLAWIARAIELDRLDRVAPYRAGVTAYRELLGAGDAEGVASA